LPVIDPMTVIHPAPRSSIDGSAARQHRNTPSTLTRSVSCHCSGVTSHSAAVGPATPLLQISPSMRPLARRATRTIGSTCSGAVTSVGTAGAAQPCSRARSRVSSNPGRPRAARTRSHPSRTKASAISLPIPWLAPVTTTTGRRSVIDQRHRPHRGFVTAPDVQREHVEREPAAEHGTEVGEVLVVGDPLSAEPGRPDSAGAATEVVGIRPASPLHAWMLAGLVLWSAVTTSMTSSLVRTTWRAPAHTNGDD
jgi:hypothetical protein